MTGGAYLNFRRHLEIDFNPTQANLYLTRIGDFEGQAERILLFLAADRGLVYSKSKKTGKRTIINRTFFGGKGKLFLFD